MKQARKEAFKAFRKYEKAILDVYNNLPGGRLDATFLDVTLKSNDVERIKRLTEWLKSETEDWKKTI